MVDNNNSSSNNSCHSLNITVKGILEDPSTGFESRFNMTVMVGDLLLKHGINVKLDLAKLYSLNLGPLTNNGYCGFSPLESFALYHVDGDGVDPSPSISAGLLNLVLDSTVSNHKHTNKNGSNTPMTTTVSLAGTPGFKGLWDALTKVGPASQQMFNEYSASSLSQMPYLCANNEAVPDAPSSSQHDSSGAGHGTLALVGMILASIFIIVIVICICIWYGILPRTRYQRLEDRLQEYDMDCELIGEESSGAR
jgi:hypothetical protein